MELRLYPEVVTAVSKSIFISGCTRTGTSLMGQLIYSLDNVEQFHEPPFLYAFMYLIDDVADDVWKFLLESFVFEEMMLPALAGRRLNFNEFDDSSVFKSKSRDEIMARLARSHRRQEIFPVALNRRISFKMPETLPRLGRLRRYFPDMTFLVMLRKPENVIASLMERGWYSDAQMTGTSGEWIFKKGHDEKLPPWLQNDMVDEYIAMPEVDRCALCYLVQYENLIDRQDCLVVDYDKLIAEPHAYFARVCVALGERFGALTPQLLDGIREPAKDRAIAVDRIDSGRHRRLTEVYAACKTLALA